jgi:DNA-binding GntR family transcriptional regulator
MRDELTSESAPYVAGRTAGGDAWAQEAAAAGRQGTQRITNVVEVPASPEVARALALTAGTSVIFRRRLVLLDGTPVEIADAYYPREIAAGTPLAGAQRIKGGAAALLATLGHRAYRTQEEVTARMPTPDERAILELPMDVPVLVLSRRTVDAADTPFEYAVMIMKAAGRVLRYEHGPF